MRTTNKQTNKQTKTMKNSTLKHTCGLSRLFGNTNQSERGELMGYCNILQLQHIPTVILYRAV